MPLLLVLPYQFSFNSLLYSLPGFFAGKVMIDGSNNLALFPSLLLAIIAAIVLFTKFTKKLNYKKGE